MPPIREVHKTTKQVADKNGKVDEREGVVFKVDQSKMYQFYMVENPSNIMVKLAEDQWSISKPPVFGLADLVEIATINIRNEAFQLSNVNQDEYFIFGGTYANHIVDSGAGLWIDVYFSNSGQNNRCRFEVKL